jgi:DNA polymerase-3 subunit delta'
VPGSDSQIGRKDALEILSTLVSRGSVPHAFLFTGKSGLGKADAARRLAMALNCQAGKPSTTPPAGPQADRPVLAAVPCSHCRSCRKIQSGHHPDIISIEATGPFIRIDQIRALCHTLAMKPYEARYRVVIIRDAQAMNPPAGNALLKMLEEPPNRTILVLTAPRAADLLPTIVSRCRQVRFSPLPPAELAALLVEREAVPADIAAILSTMADGSARRAMDLYRTGWIQRRSWLLKQLNRLSGLSTVSLMALAATLAQHRDDLGRYLDIMYIWARDLAVCRAAPDKVICRDVLGDLQAAAQTETVTALEKAETIRTARQDLKANANPRLTLEVLLLRLADADRMPYDTKV